MNAKSKTLVLAICALMLTDCRYAAVALVSATMGSGAVWGSVKLAEYRAAQVRTQSSDLQIYGISEGIGRPTVSIRKGVSTPGRVQPGQQVHILIDYSLRLPQGVKDSNVQESWILKKDGKVLSELPPQNARRTAGGWQANVSIAVPKEAAAGTYVVEHKVQTGTSSDLAQSAFVVAES